MSYRIIKSSMENYLRILIEGEWPEINPRKLMDEIFNTWQNNNMLPLLIDVREMSFNPIATNDYIDVQKFEAAGFIQLGRIAVIDKLDRKFYNDAFESWATLQGLKFKFFYTDEKNAIKWLLTGLGA